MARLPEPLYTEDSGRIRLYRGDCLELLPRLPEHGAIDLIFADPPYFLSDDGITCRAGRMVPVNKGSWDRPGPLDSMHAFNLAWLGLCRDALATDGSLWVSGTRHVIFSVGFAMQQLGMKLLNEVCWEKPNPPPNLSCRYFTHAAEILLWAVPHTRSRHVFNYEAMRDEAGGKQMKSVWRLTAPTREEKTLGRHPTQKPLALLRRIITACTRPGDLVVDPFAGSGTTGVAALALGRRFIGVERDAEFAALATRRLRATRQVGAAG
jgi:site-specific DNA-methyltransferase (adenine-specific)